MSPLTQELDTVYILNHNTRAAFSMELFTLILLYMLMIFGIILFSICAVYIFCLVCMPNSLQMFTLVRLENILSQIFE